MIHYFLPFSAVTNDVICAQIRYDQILLNAFNNCLAASTTRVKHEISLTFPGCFALVIDAQITTEAHHVAVFTTFPCKIAAGYCAVCLATSPLNVEKTHSAKGQVFFLQIVLIVFEKDVSSVVASRRNNVA